MVCRRSDPCLKLQHEFTSYHELSLSGLVLVYFRMRLFVSTVPVLFASGMQYWYHLILDSSVLIGQRNILLG